MSKTVKYKNDRLEIKFYSTNKDEFYSILDNVKKLEDRSFIQKEKLWTAPPTKENINALAKYGFDFDDSTFILFENKKECKLVIKNNYIELYANITLLLSISDNFIFDDYKYTYAGGIFDIGKIKKVRFLRLKKGKGLLPIGFLKDLLIFCKENNIIIDLTDERKNNLNNFTDEEIKNCLSYLTLYDYQTEAVKKCIKNKSGIIKLATGSGKTEIFLALCTLLKKKTLILFSKIDLAQQTLLRAKKAGLDVGIVQGNNIDEDHDIVMCTIQSSEKLNNEYEIVIIDEVHNSKSKQYQELLKKESFIFRFGFSATPYADGARNALGNNYIKRFIGDIIFEMEANKLIELNKIAKPKIKIIKIEGEIEGKDWAEVENRGIILNKNRNRIIAELSKKEKTIILVKKILHGQVLERMIYNSIFLYGNSDVELKQRMIKKFEDKNDFVIIASTIFDEGIDIKSIRNLIVASGGKSQRKTIQRLGRGTRITDDKNEVNIYDFYDDTNNILLKHSKERMLSYKKEGFKGIEII